jgi:hypothetical protein
MNSRTLPRVPFLLIAMGAAACSRSVSTHLKPVADPACIQIQQVLSAQTDDSGKTIEPFHLVFEAHGRTEDLKAGEVIYYEDDQEVRIIPVGDLRPGLQTIAIPPGFHVTTSDELFEVTLVRPDGKETPSLVLPLNHVGYAPPPKPAGSDRRKRKSSRGNERGDADQEIATVLPGVDPDEVMSIRQFGPADVGVTSIEGEVSFTKGDDADQAAQTLVLNGVNFRDGLVVRFSTSKGGQRIEATSPLTQTKTLATLTVPSGHEPNNPSTLFASVVAVPTKITHKVSSSFGVRSLQGETRSECK